MSPLLRRILFNGLLVGAILAGIGYTLAAGAFAFLNSMGGEMRIIGSPTIQMPLVMAVSGMTLVALLEWWNDRRERAKAAKSPPPPADPPEPKP